MEARPCGKSALTAVATTGSAVAIPSGASDPWFPATRVKVYVSAKAYVCLGDDSSPDSTPPARVAIQQAETEEVYTLSPRPDALQDHVWIYAVASTIDADVSFFG